MRANRLSLWKKCPRCQGQSYWEPLGRTDNPARRGMYTCLSCSRVRDESDDEVLARAGAPVLKSPEDKLREELEKARSQLKVEAEVGKKLSDVQLERIMSKGPDVSSYDSMHIYKAARDKGRVRA